MENEVIIETVQNEDGTQTTTITEPIETSEVNQTDVIPNEESTEDSDGKLGLAVLALGGAAIAGVTAVVIKKIKNGRAAKKAEENPDEDPKPEKPKKGKRVQQMTKGRKLTIAERIKGCELTPVEPEEKIAEPAEEDEA